MKEYFIITLGVIVSFIALLLFIIVPVFFFEGKKCEVTANRMEIESDFTLMEGCMVKINDRWQPFNEYTTVNITK